MLVPPTPNGSHGYVFVPDYDHLVLTFGLTSGDRMLTSITDLHMMAYFQRHPQRLKDNLAMLADERLRRGHLRYGQARPPPQHESTMTTSRKHTGRSFRSEVIELALTPATLAATHCYITMNVQERGVGHRHRGASEISTEGRRTSAQSLGPPPRRRLE